MSSYESNRSSRNANEMIDARENLLDVITEKPNDESGNAFVRQETSEMSDLGNENLDESINKPMQTKPSRRNTALSIQTDHSTKTEKIFSDNDDEEQEYMEEFVDRVEKRLGKDWYHLIEKEV